MHNQTLRSILNKRPYKISIFHVYVIIYLPLSSSESELENDYKNVFLKVYVHTIYCISRL